MANHLEKESIHIVIADGHSLVAYGRLFEIKSNTFKVSQLVVTPVLQRRGYGPQLLQCLIDRAVAGEAAQIELNSQASAKSLYSRLGFVEVGDVYPSKTTGVSHVKMVRPNAG